MGPSGSDQNRNVDDLRATTCNFTDFVAKIASGKGGPGGVGWAGDEAWPSIHPHSMPHGREERFFSFFFFTWLVSTARIL